MKLRPVPDERSRQHGWAVNGNSADHGVLSYGDVEPLVLSAFVSAVTDEGDAVLLGRTTDGGAFLVSVLSGGDAHKRYFTSVEALEVQARAFVTDKG